MNEESLFAALETPTAADQHAFLDEACGGDDRLHQRVEQLAAQRQARGTLDRTQDAAVPGAYGPEPPLAAGVEKLQLRHETSGGIVRSLCDCHEQLKQYEQAEAWRRKWLAVVKERAGPESVACAVESAA